MYIYIYDFEWLWDIWAHCEHKWVPHHLWEQSCELRRDLVSQTADLSHQLEKCSALWIIKIKPAHRQVCSSLIQILRMFFSSDSSGFLTPWRSLESKNLILPSLAQCMHWLRSCQETNNIAHIHIIFSTPWPAPICFLRRITSHCHISFGYSCDVWPCLATGP